VRPSIQELIRCPVTRQPLNARGGELVSEDGTQTYPVVAGIPILIDEERSVFRKRDYVGGASAGPKHDHRRGVGARLLAAVDGRLPTLSRNVGTDANFRRLLELARADHGNEIQILVVGGSTEGAGFRPVIEAPGTELVETDIAFGPRTNVICDGHALPFADGTFDVVICQAVLEHVLDPATVVAEIHRVLSDSGLVYSEIPFMQQVHGGAHDVTRFTLLGHRRLYRRFDVIEMGAQGGPGMALAWSLSYFLVALSRSRRKRQIATRLARLLGGWLTRWDHILVTRPAGVDAASGTFLLGRRRDEPVPDQEILRGYVGIGPQAVLSRW
jgi:SAM-dependent methyltransferase